MLGENLIPATVVELSDLDARLWEISENLHRAELTVGERAEQVAEYARLATEKRDVQSGQVAHNESKREDGRGHRHEGGDSLAARDLGITREEVRRAKTIAALPERTKRAARDAGLDDNQSALLKAARAPTPEEQINILNGIAVHGSVAAASRAASDSNAVLLNDRASGSSAQSVKPLRNLENISGGELARWIKITTPNDRPHVIRVLETAAAILRDESSPSGRSAEEFLRAELADGDWHVSFDLEAKADAAGIPQQDLAQARHRLGVETRQWMGTPRKWRLPDEEARDG